MTFCLSHLPDAAGAQRLELHLALVRHHGAGTGHHLAVELDLEQLRVLQPQARLAGLLLEIVGREQLALHVVSPSTGHSPSTRDSRPSGQQTRIRRRRAADAGSAPAELVQPLVVDAEVVGDLVDDRGRDLLHHVVLGVAHAQGRVAVDGDAVGQDAARSPSPGR